MRPCRLPHSRKFGALTGQGVLGLPEGPTRDSSPQTRLTSSLFSSGMAYGAHVLLSTFAELVQRNLTR